MYSVALLVLALAASASAFAPVAAPARSGAVKAVENELGVLPPLGFWDPLGLSADGDMETFTRRRAVEIKHGRICMLAFIGYITTEYVRLPGQLSFSENINFADVPVGTAAYNAIPYAGWVQIIGIAGLFETIAWPASDYSCSYGWNVIDDAGDGDKLTKEIQNGRAAMIGIAGIWASEAFDADGVWPYTGTGVF
jgi:hypothetical protein